MVRARGLGATFGRVLAGLLALVVLVAAPATRAQDFGALARLAGMPTVEAGWRSLSLGVPLTQPVPWRTRLMTDPPRAVVDFRTLDWTGFDAEALALPAAARALRVGNAGGGWSRLIVELARPMGFAEAGMVTDAEAGTATLSIRLVPVSEAEFARQAAALAAGDAPDPAADGISAPQRPPLGQRATVVVLDPGHGGVDPGAIHGNVSEAAIMLTFARELAEVLRRTGRYEVVMTRDGDTFVSLEGRITVAHSAQADLFLSLHADALEDGEAVGATVYTLSEEASDEASAVLAERHDRDDLLGGVDLSGTDDGVATVLMDLARARTGPATDQLARLLVAAIREADLPMHRHPWQQAAFSVLKSPSVPSALIEVGFLSSDRDRARLQDRRWRARMTRALLRGIDAWVAEEGARQTLSRR